MRAVDGKIIVIPNGKIIAGNIINYSREPVRRNEFIIGVAYDSDIDQVKQLLTTIIESDDRILKDREMTVRLNELGASSINFVVRVWSKSSDLQNVYWDVLERIKREFDAAGISFPYPQMDVNFKRVKDNVAGNFSPALPAGAALIRLQYSLVIERISVAAIRYSVSSLAFLISD